ncbi:MAG: hypothetical protein ACQESX_09590 [Bacteroidota bacterium]
MKKTALILGFAALLSLSAAAQQYDKAIGIRGGLFNGVTYKQAISSDTYLEGIASFRWNGFMVTGLYEITQPIDSNAPGLDWYYGFGAHVGFYDDNENGPWDEGDFDGPMIGADGILGMEYTFGEVPVNLSLDWKPAINLFGYDGFWSDNVALSIRYTF